MLPVEDQSVVGPITNYLVKQQTKHLMKFVTVNGIGSRYRSNAAAQS
jgi:hypothetical protein